MGFEMLDDGVAGETTQISPGSFSARPQLPDCGCCPAGFVGIHHVWNANSPRLQTFVQAEGPSGRQRPGMPKMIYVVEGHRRAHKWHPGGIFRASYGKPQVAGLQPEISAAAVGSCFLEKR